MIRGWQIVQGNQVPQDNYVRDGKYQVLTKNVVEIEENLYQWDEICMPISEYNDIAASICNQTDEELFDLAQMVDENSQAIMELAEIIEEQEEE